nr:hypothetical protein [Tanacetum cinerariifolium]
MVDGHVNHEARRFLQKTGINLGDNRVTSMGFDMSKVECYNCHRKGYFARECRSLKDSRMSGATEPHKRTAPVKNSTSNALVSQCDGIGCYDWSYQVEEEPANFALMAITSSSSSSDNETNEKHVLGYFSSESDYESLSPSSLSDRSQPSGGYHAVPSLITGTFMPPKPDLVFYTTPIDVETDHYAFTIQLSPSKPTQDLSHTNRPSAPIIEDWVSDFEDGSKTNDPQSVPSFVQSSKQVKTPRHYVQPVEAPILDATLKPTSPTSNSSSKRRNRKTCFVCRSVDHLIKDCDYHAKKKAQPTPRNYAHEVLTQSKLVSITAVRLVCAVVPKIMVTRPRHAHSIDTKSKLPIRRHITCSPSPKTSNSALVLLLLRLQWLVLLRGNPQYALKDIGVIDSGCLRHMTRNISYLSDFEKLNAGYVTFGGNPRVASNLEPLVRPSLSVLLTNPFSGPILKIFEEMEEITYSDHENVGAEADFNNLETSITVSPFLATRIHKNHPVLQIIGDLSSTNQTRSMTRVIKDQGFEDPDHLDKVYKVVKALYGLHQAPRAWLMIVSLMYLTSSRPDIMFAVSTSSNDVTRLQALVDRKKVVITEAAIRDVLCLDDADGVDCLPMKIFLLYWAKTPLFEGMLVAGEIEEQGDAEEQRIESSADTDMKDASNYERMIADLDMDIGYALIDDEGIEKKAEDAQVPSDEQVKGRQAEIYQIDMDHASKVLSMPKDKPEVQEAVDVVTTAKLIIEVVATVSKLVTAADASIADVPATTITIAPVRVAAAFTKRRKGVVIRDPEEESTATIPAETKSKDKGKGIMVEEPKPMKKKQHVKMDKEYAKKLREELNKDIDWSVAIDHIKQKAKEDLLDYFKGMSYDDIRLIFEAKFNSNTKFLLKSKEQIEEEENREIECVNETPAQKATKKRKLNEKVEDLKQHLEIVSDEDNDVYTEATLLSRKVPVLDYQIIQLNNKPRYKIIRANGTHQLYVSFITLLKNFDREDLESLWSIVKERFSTSKLNNFSDDYLLTTLRSMFERPDGQDQL